MQKHPIHISIFENWIRLGGISRIRGHSFIQNLIPQNAVIADFGAHKGEFCAALEQTTNVQRSVSLEANPVLASFLIEQSKHQNSQSIIHAALVGSNASKELNFQLSDNPEASSILTSVPAIFGFKEVVTVPTMTLDEVAKMISEPRIHLVKMDIEGAELDVLQTTSRDTFDRIDQMTVEFHDMFDPKMRPVVQNVRKWMKNEQGFVELNAKWPNTDDILFVNRHCIKEMGWLRFWLTIYLLRAAYLIRGLSRGVLGNE